MVIVGIVLVAVAVGLGAAIVGGNTEPTSLNVFGHRIPGVSTQAHVFILGVIVAVVFVVGLMITMMALGRLLRARRELRDLREEHEESLTSLEMEKRQLERELARARSTAPAASASASHADDTSVVDPTLADAPRALSIRPETSPFFERS